MDVNISLGIIVTCILLMISIDSLYVYNEENNRNIVSETGFNLSNSNEKTDQSISDKYLKPSITVDTNKIHYGIGEIVHIFGNANYNNTKAWSDKIIIEITNTDNNSNVVYRKSLFPINGTYNLITLNTLEPGKYIINVSMDNARESSWTQFHTVDYWKMWSLYSILGGILNIIILAIIHAVGIRNVRLIEIINFLLLSGIVLSIILAIFFADVNLGLNSPIGLVLKNPVDDEGNVKLNPYGQPETGGQWIINVGGNQRNNYEDGIEIPVYVVVFGIIGGYLRYLYETATNRRNETLKEFNRIEREVERIPDSEFMFRERSAQKRIINFFTQKLKIQDKNDINDDEVKLLNKSSLFKKQMGLSDQDNYSEEEIKYLVRHKRRINSLRKDEMYREKHKYYLFHTLMDLALLFLAPILAIVVWFLLSQAGIQGDNNGVRGQTGIFILAVVSFTVGLVTNEVVKTLIRFTTGMLESIGRSEPSNKTEAGPITNSKLIVNSVSEPEEVHIGDLYKIKITISDEKSGEKISGAKVIGNVKDPSNNSYYKLEEQLSDNNGEVKYEWKVDENSLRGTYTINFEVFAHNYEPVFTEDIYQVL